MGTPNSSVSEPPTSEMSSSSNRNAIWEEAPPLFFFRPDPEEEEEEDALPPNLGRERFRLWLPGGRGGRGGGGGGGRGSWRGREECVAVCGRMKKMKKPSLILFVCVFSRCRGPPVRSSRVQRTRRPTQHFMAV
jgi:hypothetical protein